MKVQMLALLASLLAAVGSARADEVQFVSYTTFTAQSENDNNSDVVRLVNLNSEEAGNCPDGSCNAGQGTYGSGAGGGYDICGPQCTQSCGNSCCNQPCDSCCQFGCCNSCGSSGIYAYGEALVVRPYSSWGQFAMGQFSYQATPRVTLGWQGDSGFGLRGRYWMYDHRAPFNANAFNLIVNLAGLNQDLKVHVGDLEFTQQFCVCQCSVTAFAGVRYNSYLDRTLDNRGGVAFRHLFTGFGPTAGLEVVRPIACGWSLYGNGRYSILLGKQNVLNPLVFAAGFTDQVIREIGEIGGGLQYSKTLKNDVTFTARAGFEAQFWQGFAFDPGNVLPGARSAGFAGFTGGLGICY